MTNATDAELPVLTSLLSAAGWHGSQRCVFESMPHMSDRLSIEDVIATIGNLKIPTSVAKGSPHRIADGDVPLLFSRKDGRFVAILDVAEDELLVIEPGEVEPVWKPRWRERGQLIRLERFDIELSEVSSATVFEFIREFSSLFSWLFVSALLTNFMGLATPLLVMVIYDRVIPAGSTHMVLALMAFAIGALAADFGFRMARARAIAHIGSQTERKLSHALVRKIMALQIGQIEKNDVEKQLARFKQFEALREAFSGQVIGSLLDLPFVLIFLAVIAWISLPIFFLILALIVVFVVIAVVSFPKQQRLNSEAARHKSALQANVFETTRHQQDIQRLGLTSIWENRNESLSAKAADAGQRARRFQMTGQGISQSLMSIAGVGAIAISTVAAMEGSMSFGALIAIMALVWKVLTPIVALYSGAPQVFGYIKSQQQIDRVLALPEERMRGAGKSHQKKLRGEISVANVTFRYSQTGTIALSQVSLDIAPEEFVYLSGEINSGKSTLMSLLAGLYQTSVGTIALDGIDIRQIAVDDLRQSVTYAKGHGEHFYGTIYQNFRLASPDIMRDEVEEAIRRMGLEADVLGLEEGIDTRLTESFRNSLPRSTLHALALARCFARKSSIYIFSNPSSGLDSKRRLALLRCLERLRNEKKTIILASTDEELMPLADRFVLMQQGRVVVDDHGVNGRRKVQAILEKNRS